MPRTILRHTSIHLDGLTLAETILEINKAIEKFGADAIIDIDYPYESDEAETMYIATIQP